MFKEIISWSWNNNTDDGTRESETWAHFEICFFSALQNQLKVVWGIVQKEHEDIDERYSKEMHSLVTQLLAKVPYSIIGNWDSRDFLNTCGAKRKKENKNHRKYLRWRFLWLLVISIFVCLYVSFYRLAWTPLKNSYPLDEC